MTDASPVIRPESAAVFHSDRMGKATLFESPRLLVGLNSFEVGQSHELHVHADMDKAYYVITGNGSYLLDGSEHAIRSGDLMIAPAGQPHGIKNPGPERLIVLAVLAPAPTKKAK